MPASRPALLKSLCPSFASPAKPFSCAPQLSRRIAFLVAAAALSGCGYADPDRFAPACPKVAILPDAADLTIYRAGGAGAGRDLTDMVLDARITGLSGRCSRTAETSLATHVALAMQFSRGPAAQTRQMDVQYLIGVFDGETRVLDKKIFPVHLEFPPNVDKLVLDTPDVELALPISKTRSGAAYTVRVGFQLTPDQLAYNRRRGSRPAGDAPVR